LCQTKALPSKIAAKAVASLSSHISSKPIKILLEPAKKIPGMMMSLRGVYQAKAKDGEVYHAWRKEKCYMQL
jgi:hypothetical protein